jgi:hypothetical protein
MIYPNTHVVVRLYAFAAERLSERAFIIRPPGEGSRRCRFQHDESLSVSSLRRSFRVRFSHGATLP